MYKQKYLRRRQLHGIVGAGLLLAWKRCHGFLISLLDPEFHPFFSNVTDSLSSTGEVLHALFGIFFPSFLLLFLGRSILAILGLTEFLWLAIRVVEGGMWRPRKANRASSFPIKSWKVVDVVGGGIRIPEKRGPRRGQRGLQNSWCARPSPTLGPLIHREIGRELKSSRRRLLAAG